MRGESLGMTPRSIDPVIGARLSSPSPRNSGERVPGGRVRGRSLPRNKCRQTDQGGSGYSGPSFNDAVVNLPARIPNTRAIERKPSTASHRQRTTNN
jgi:hypothetical protein